MLYWEVWFNVLMNILTVVVYDNPQENYQLSWVLKENESSEIRFALVRPYSFKTLEEVSSDKASSYWITRRKERRKKILLGTTKKIF